ncbi:hypothetical protein DFH08DRAFT_820000 [Mycena albidolilacea]|uniref:AAA+ ATPase domain-containing protein n=1 Tax=Mycena albidolilacea TaxID=1033008 RepID=A0AAD7EG33_9AGAR|nr:hypothetical protein DFH08DRAFT_820000 [Mycena albidolilacea]
MPTRSSRTQVRLSMLTTCFAITVDTMEILADSLNATFLMAIVHTTRSLLKNIEASWFSDTGGVLPPTELNQIGNFIETLHKIYTFVEAQQSGRKIKQLFDYTEKNTLLKSCRDGLIHALDSFQDVTKIYQDAEQTHKKVLSMIEGLSDTTSSDKASLVGSWNLSAGCLNHQPGMWLPTPAERPLRPFFKAQRSPRIAILGTGGIGKTSLATVVLHHPETTAKYTQHRYFVACDSAANQVELAALIGAHLGLRHSPNLTQAIVKFLATASPSLLILDNLETVWEPTELCGDIEEFLSLITDIKDLALIITMRGAERPSKVHWTRPFLLPLHPLDKNAAHQTFVDIAEDHHNAEEVKKILSLTDNMPLAINLIAHLVDQEGCSNELLRLYKEYQGTQMGSATIVQVLSNIANIQNVLSHILQPNHPDIKNTILCASSLNLFSRLMGRGPISLLGHLQKILPHLDDHWLEASLITELFATQKWSAIPNPDSLVAKALQHFRQIDDSDLQCQFYRRVSGHYSEYAQDFSTAIKFCHLAISLAISTGNTNRQSEALVDLSLISCELGDYPASLTHAWEAQKLARISANLYREAQALFCEAKALGYLGNYKQSIPLCNRGRNLIKHCGMSGGTLHHDLMTQQAEDHKMMSEYNEAHNIYTLILQEVSLEQQPYSYAMALMNIAEIAVTIGTPKNSVQRDIEKSKALIKATNHVAEVVMCEIVLADLFLREGDTVQAITLFKQYLTFNHAEIKSYCLDRLGNVDRWDTSHWAFGWTTVYLAHSLKFKEQLGIYKALQYSGDIFLAKGDKNTAASIFTVALDGFTFMNIHCSRAECLLRLGDILRSHGDLIAAVKHWDNARPLFECSSQTKQTSKYWQICAGAAPKKNLAQLVEINAPTSIMVEQTEEDLSEAAGLSRWNAITSESLNFW